MKRLILMRHAKSDWSLGQADHERPLNKRGRNSAKALGVWMRDRAFVPDEVLCSSAARTRETFDLLKLESNVRFLRDLYLAPPNTMFDCLNEARGDTVLMLGHNPGIAEFAATLVQTAPDHARFADYPTCATLVVDFDVDSWAKAEPGTGRAQAFVIPRDLLTA